MQLRKAVIATEFYNAKGYLQYLLSCFRAVYSLRLQQLECTRKLFTTPLHSLLPWYHSAVLLKRTSDECYCSAKLLEYLMWWNVLTLMLLKLGGQKTAVVSLFLLREFENQINEAPFHCTILTQLFSLTEPLIPFPKRTDLSCKITSFLSEGRLSQTMFHRRGD